MTMSYCLWQNVRADLGEGFWRWHNQRHLSDEEKAAMKDCLNLFHSLVEPYMSDECQAEMGEAMLQLFQEIDADDEDEEDT